MVTPAPGQQHLHACPCPVLFLLSVAFGFCSRCQLLSPFCLSSVPTPAEKLAVPFILHQPPGPSASQPRADSKAACPYWE